MSATCISPFYYVVGTVVRIVMLLPAPSPLKFKCRTMHLGRIKCGGQKTRP